MTMKLLLPRFLAAVLFKELRSAFNIKFSFFVTLQLFCHYIRIFYENMCWYKTLMHICRISILIGIQKNLFTNDKLIDSKMGYVDIIVVKEERQALGFVSFQDKSRKCREGCSKTSWWVNLSGSCVVWMIIKCENINNKLRLRHYKKHCNLSFCYNVNHWRDLWLWCVLVVFYFREIQVINISLNFTQYDCLN